MIYFWINKYEDKYLFIDYGSTSRFVLCRTFPNYQIFYKSEYYDDLDILLSELIIFKELILPKILEQQKRRKTGFFKVLFNTNSIP